MDILNTLKEGEVQLKIEQESQDQKNLEMKEESQDQKNLEMKEIEPSSIYKRHIINYITLINEINRDTFHIGC
jgi:hypothetical protein